MERECVAELLDSPLSFRGSRCIQMDLRCTRIILPLLFGLFFGIGYGSAAHLLPWMDADIFSEPDFGSYLQTDRGRR